MTAAVVLGVIALAQGVFLLLLVLFLAVRREVDRSRHHAFLSGRQELTTPLNEWLAGDGAVEPFVAALRSLPVGTTIGLTVNLVRGSIPREAREALAVALRAEPWIRRGLDGASSRRWSRRLEAARCLALVGTPDDAPSLSRLLNDRRPAVAAAAVTALPRVADAALVREVLDRIVTMPIVVRLYLQTTLRELRELVEPALVERLASTAPASSLARWVELAGALDLPVALDAVGRLAAHEAPTVREAVARALRRAPSRRSADLIAQLLVDASPRVRAAAAHSLGELASSAAVPLLLGAARDDAWFVRYRAVLALSQLGEPGRSALRSLSRDGDRYVADMATLIGGLSDGALLDMVEG